MISNNSTFSPNSLGLWPVYFTPQEKKSSTPPLSPEIEKQLMINQSNRVTANAGINFIREKTLELKNLRTEKISEQWSSLIRKCTTIALIILGGILAAGVVVGVAIAFLSTAPLFGFGPALITAIFTGATLGLELFPFYTMIYNRYQELKEPSNSENDLNDRITALEKELKEVVGDDIEALLEVAEDQLSGEIVKLPRIKATLDALDADCNRLLGHF